MNSLKNENNSQKTAGDLLASMFDVPKGFEENGKFTKHKTAQLSGFMRQDVLSPCMKPHRHTSRRRSELRDGQLEALVEAAESEEFKKIHASHPFGIPITD